MTPSVPPDWDKEGYIKFVDMSMVPNPTISGAKTGSAVITSTNGPTGNPQLGSVTQWSTWGELFESDDDWPRSIRRKKRYEVDLGMINGFKCRILKYKGQEAEFEIGKKWGWGLTYKETMEIHNALGGSKWKKWCLMNLQNEKVHYRNIAKVLLRLNEEE